MTPADPRIEDTAARLYNAQQRDSKSRWTNALEIVRRWYREMVVEFFTAADAADRAAGVVRVDTTDPAVRKRLDDAIDATRRYSTIAMRDVVLAALREDQ